MWWWEQQTAVSGPGAVCQDLLIHIIGSKREWEVIILSWDRNVNSLLNLTPCLVVSDLCYWNIFLVWWNIFSACWSWELSATSGGRDWALRVINRAEPVRSSSLHRQQHADLGQYYLQTVVTLELDKRVLREELESIDSRTRKYW